jgi:histidine triad (HIT) family protein
MPAYDETNIFAQILRGELPCHKVHETDHVLSFMDIMPRTEGHVLVLPKAKARTLLDIDPEDLKRLIVEVQKVARAAKEALGADGVTIWQFNEEAGGQEIPHLHFHILPRKLDVSLRPRPSTPDDPETLAAVAKKIAAVLEAQN